MKTLMQMIFFNLRCQERFYGEKTKMSKVNLQIEWCTLSGLCRSVSALMLIQLLLPTGFVLFSPPVKPSFIQHGQRKNTDMKVMLKVSWRCVLRLWICYISIINVHLIYLSHSWFNICSLFFPVTFALNDLIHANTEIWESNTQVHLNLS